MSPKRALAQLVLLFLDGRNYETQNPYARPEVLRALRVLGVEDAEGVRALAEGKRPRARRRK